MTFLAVNIAWVFFRAENFENAFAVLSAMMGMTAGSTQIFELKHVGIILGLIAVCTAAPGVSKTVPKYFQPNYKWFAFITVLFFYTLSRCTQASEFLYFQF